MSATEARPERANSEPAVDPIPRRSRPFRLRRGRHAERLHRARAGERILRTVVPPPEPIRRRQAGAVTPAGVPAASDPRLRQVARALVRTMRSCPAPGVAPLTWRDWLLLGGVVLVPYALLLAGVAVGGRH